MSHAWRPLFVVVGILAIIFVARAIFVPADFMAKNGDYKYQWHRVGNEEEWKNFPVKYKGGIEFCGDCHDDEFEDITASKHAMIQCENCHGPALNHADEDNPDPEKLTIDRGRDLCLRCHAKLPYRPITYNELPEGQITLLLQDPEDHNPDEQCVECHDVHKAEIKEELL